MSRTGVLFKLVLLLLILCLLSQLALSEFVNRSESTRSAPLSSVELNRISPDNSTVGVIFGNKTMINASELNISMSNISRHWAGFIGNISIAEGLAIENSSGSVKYMWGGTEKSGLELLNVVNFLFVSQNSAETFDSLSNSTNNSNLGALWNQTLGNDTFSTIFLSREDLSVGTSLLNTAFAYTKNNVSEDTFITYLFSNAESGVSKKSDLIIATVPNPNNTSFRGDLVDFQIIVPVDSSQDGGAIETYYFFLDVY